MHFLVPQVLSPQDISEDKVMHSQKCLGADVKTAAYIEVFSIPFLGSGWSVLTLFPLLFCTEFFFNFVGEQIMTALVFL